MEMEMGEGEGEGESGRRSVRHDTSCCYTARKG